MDLQFSGKKFAVGGATSGLGRAVAERLISEGATVIGFARSRQTLDAMALEHGNRFLSFPTDTADGVAVRKLGDHLIQTDVDGVVFNTGGPRTGTVDELSMDDWDKAYAGTLRWKIALTTQLLPHFRGRGRGHFLYLESISIKQPIDNLVLSNAMRAAVAGFVKTLSREVGGEGIRLNILAPGYHATDRITSVLEKAAALQNEEVESVRESFLAEVPVKTMGQPEDFAAVAAFLLSPYATYLNGQTLSVDGGLVRHITG